MGSSQCSITSISHVVSCVSRIIQSYVIGTLEHTFAIHLPVQPAPALPAFIHGHSKCDLERDRSTDALEKCCSGLAIGTKHMRNVLEVTHMSWVLEEVDRGERTSQKHRGARKRVLGRVSIVQDLVALTDFLPNPSSIGSGVCRSLPFCQLWILTCAPLVLGMAARTRRPSLISFLTN